MINYFDPEIEKCQVLNVVCRTLGGPIVIFPGFGEEALLLYNDTVKVIELRRQAASGGLQSISEAEGSAGPSGPPLSTSSKVKLSTLSIRQLLDIYIRIIPTIAGVINVVMWSSEQREMNWYLTD